MFIIGNGAISWSFKKQSIVTLSTAEVLVCGSRFLLMLSNLVVKNFDVSEGSSREFHNCVL